MSNVSLYLLIALAPLLGAILAGLFGTGFLGRFIGRRASHMITIALVAVSAIGSVYVLYQVLNDPSGMVFNQTIYTWSMINDIKLEIGFQIDPLSALMMVSACSCGMPSL